ncbi:MAG: PEGA domain-containing protein [Kofleriaceae bacterium]|nr:PEGA domain-containing protein [Kofleriaceae bacterium]
MVIRPEPRRVAVAIVVAVVALVAVATPPAAAQGAAKQAEREYKLGYRALQAGDCAEALTHYQRSYQLAPRPRTLFNMATCQEQLGQDAEAWRNYHTFLDQAEARDAAIVVTARERIELLRQRLSGRVTVTSSPAGAEVRVDGERSSRAVTPVTLTLAPGSHVIRVSMPDAVAAERTVEIAPEATVAIGVELTLPSAITLVADPEDAMIDPGDGSAPVRGRYEARVAIGRHELTVRRDGYRSEHVVIDAVAGRTYEQRVTLRPDPSSSTLVVRGVAGATVTVDGVAAPAPASGTLAMRDLATGEHEVRVTRAGRSPWHDQIHLSPGETVTVAVELAAPRSPARRATGWGALGIGAVAVAAGSVVGVGALRDVTGGTPDDHDRGKRHALIADGLFVVGAAAVITAWRLLRGAPASSATVHRAMEPGR